MMTTLQTIVDSSVRGAQTEIGAIASIDEQTAVIMVWNYHDMDFTSTGEPIKLSITGILTSAVTVTYYHR